MVAGAQPAYPWGAAATSLAGEIDFDEIRAAKEEADREGREELVFEMEERLAVIIRFARELAGGTVYEMADAISEKVTEMGLSNGEMAFLVGLFALGLARPDTTRPVVDRLARHLYVTGSHLAGAERRWHQDVDIQEAFRSKARIILEVAYDL